MMRNIFYGIVGLLGACATPSFTRDTLEAYAISRGLPVERPSINRTQIDEDTTKTEIMYADGTIEGIVLIYHGKGGVIVKNTTHTHSEGRPFEGILDVDNMTEVAEGYFADPLAHNDIMQLAAHEAGLLPRYRLVDQSTCSSGHKGEYSSYALQRDHPDLIRKLTESADENGDRIITRAEVFRYDLKNDFDKWCKEK